MLGVEEAKRGRKGFPKRRNSMSQGFGMEKYMGHLRDGKEDEVPGTLWVKERVT